MKTKRKLLCIAASVLALLAPVHGVAQSLLYGITQDSELIRFQTTGDAIQSGPSLTGIGESESIVAMDFRPRNGILYAITRDSQDMGHVYTVDILTGQMSEIMLSGQPLHLPGIAVGADFNPAALAGVNALRIVTSEGNNYRLVFNEAGATVNVDGTMNLPDDPGPILIVATAYSNNTSGLPGTDGSGGTAQYALDAATSSIYRVNPPNNGTLVERKPLGVELTAPAGLDLVTGSNRVLALLTVDGGKGLYEISLETGMATMLRTLPSDVLDIATPIPLLTPEHDVAQSLLYGITQDSQIIRFQTTGDLVQSGPNLIGIGESESIVAMDFRPRNGILYAITRDSQDMGHVYTVDILTGQMSEIMLSGQPLLLPGIAVGADFNPAALAGVNALRIVTSEGNNYRLVFNEAGATVNVDGTMNLPDDPGPIQIVATAYSNNTSGLPGTDGSGGTAQYALDAATSSIYRVNPPNNGTLVERKPLLGVEFTAPAGLDLVTGSNRVLALLTVEGEKGLYEISLETGIAIKLRTLPSDVVDIATPIPLSGIAASMETDGQPALTWSGGVGPFAVKRADVVSDPYCSIVAMVSSPFPIDTTGPSGFFQVTDLALGAPVRFSVQLSGAAERPNPVSTEAMGFGTLELNGHELTVDVSYQGLSADAVAAHIHGPAGSEGTAGVLIDLGPLHNGGFAMAGTFSGTVMLTSENVASLLNGHTYVNIHTSTHPGGEIRGQVAPVVHKTILRGVSERPQPANSPAYGSGVFALVGNELSFTIPYSGLTGPATGAHLHGPSGRNATAGVLVDLAPFNGGAFGSSGMLSGTATLSQDQLSALTDGHVYVNIHTAAFPGGEIRGQITPEMIGTVFSAPLTGAAERPNPVTTDATGFANLTLEGDTLTFDIHYSGLSGNATAAHIHGTAPASGTAGVAFDLHPFHLGPFSSEGRFSGSVTLSAQQKVDLMNGLHYINIHTSQNPGGEIRGQVAQVSRQVTLSGAAERPNPVTTSGMGRGYIGLVGNQAVFGLHYADLSDSASAAHIHGPASEEAAAGVLIDLAPFAQPGMGGRGYYKGMLTLTDSNLARLIDNMTYVNIHTAAHPGGEIRGQITP